MNDGRCEHITIAYDSDAPGAMGWGDFLEKLKKMEAEWAGEETNASL